MADREPDAGAGAAPAAAALSCVALRPSDQFQTPPEIFSPLEARYRFCWDLAATRENSKCGPARCFTIDDSALEKQWHIIGVSWWPDACRWLWDNPPYSKPNLHLFTAKAREEARRGAAIVQLVPATVGAGWFQDNVMHGVDITDKRMIRNEGHLNGLELVGSGGDFRVTVRFLRRRINFFNPLKDTDNNSAKTDSMLIEWRPRRLFDWRPER